MNTVRKIENMMIYIRFIKMKLMCGINNRSGTAEKKILLNLKTSGQIIQNQTQEKKDWKSYTEYELAM